MNRLLLLVVAGTALYLLAAQEPMVGTLPPGPPPGPQSGPWLVDALFVQANMIQGGEVMFLVPAEELDANGNPQPPSVFLKVDGKAVRAFDTRRKPLDVQELEARLSLRTAAVVVHGSLPDDFFLKAINERSVVFVVTTKLFRRLARSAGQPMSIAGYWKVLKPGLGEDVPTGDVWNISDTKVALHRQGTLEVNFAYVLDGTDYPKTINFTPDAGPAKGKSLLGIYELDGNRLKICYVSPSAKSPERVDRPREFGERGTVTVLLGWVPP